jgi:hypothetical protein
MHAEVWQPKVSWDSLQRPMVRGHIIAMFGGIYRLGRFGVLAKSN